MKRKSALFLVGFMFVLWITPLCLYAATVHVENNEKEIKATEKLVKETIGKNFADFITMGTGVIKSGSQIPLPVYQDGVTAKREECHYFVSPNEVATTMTYLSTVPGVFFIQSSVDEEGFVKVDLKQVLAHNNQEVDIAEGLHDPDSKESEEYNKRHHIRAVGADGELSETAASGYGGYKQNILEAVREKTLLNYFVIAIRSSAPESNVEKTSGQSIINMKPS